MAQSSSFVKAFLPGMVLGLIIGALAGAFLPPFLESRAAAFEGDTPKLTTPTERHAPTQEEIDDAKRRAEEQAPVPPSDVTTPTEPTAPATPDAPAPGTTPAPTPAPAT